MALPPPRDVADGRAPLLGVVTDPWQVRTWNAGVGRRFNAVMAFDAWSARRDIRPRLAQAVRRGVVPIVTWEPWEPTPPARGQEAQAAAQPAYACAAIAAGAHDAYVRDVAGAIRDAGTPVLIRLAHEMDGRWYPWSADPRAYVRAWRHVVDRFREEGAIDARFVWSPTASLWQPLPRWRDRLEAFWPGEEHVDWVGASVIGFRDGDRSVAAYAPRLDALRAFGLPVVLAEVNVDHRARVAFIDDLRAFLRASPWVRGVVLSQAPSRGVATGSARGDLDWTLRDDADAAPRWAALMADLGAPEPTEPDLA